MRIQIFTGFAALAFVAGSADAAVVAVNSAGALSANDSIDWGQLGAAFASVASPATVTSALGSTSIVLDSSGNMERRDQGNGWSGNFANGAKLLWNQGDGTLTINFASAVKGVGAKVQRDTYGAFVAGILVNGGALGSFNFNGNASAAGDDSTIFAGVLSDAYDINSVTFTMDGGGSSFAIANLLFGAGANNGVPEPATWALMIGGFGMAGFAARRRARTSITYA